MSLPQHAESTAALHAAVDRLLARIQHWGPARWEQPSRAGREAAAATLGSNGSTGLPSRAELVFGLVQELADAAADAEGRSRRPVPRLDNDLALPDQLRVMVADLLTVGASDAAIQAAAAQVAAVAAAL